jgi:hypothetical protein
MDLYRKNKWRRQLNGLWGDIGFVAFVTFVIYICIHLFIYLQARYFNHLVSQIGE